MLQCGGHCDPSGNVSYNIVDNSTLVGTDCTKYLGDQPAVLYTFVMDQQKHCEGYVVQWNRRTATRGINDATDCPNKVPEMAAYASKPFSEAWYVVLCTCARANGS